MKLGPVGEGCPDCGRAIHEGACLPPAPPIPDFRFDPGSKEPPLPLWLKVFLWVALAAAVAIGFSFILRIDMKERDEWRADWKRRTELCEAQGGIPRYQVRGRSYDGCDFPPRQQ